ncbi:glutathione S-transferase [gamma proteobacterium HIMB55]|nr:glutathione S-transferase [gamma proteobacterium HIMB55]
MIDTPILYSFRRCPYAMRARMAIAYADINVGLREVVLKDKPPAMLEVSPKGTVPVVIDVDGTIIEESRDVMRWALHQNDPDAWLAGLGLDDPLISACDDDFKHWLDRYKYAVRFPEQDEIWYRGQAEAFLATLEPRLGDARFLNGSSLSVTDIAVFPFIRQFANVDLKWWDDHPYPNVARWLDGLVSSELFIEVMKKYPQWQDGDPEIAFPSWKALSC